MDSAIMKELADLLVSMGKTIGMLHDTDKDLARRVLELEERLDSWEQK